MASQTSTCRAWLATLTGAQAERCRLRAALG
jgi:hypothetical protein